jgi:single-strand DNA-binding protein
VIRPTIRLTAGEYPNVARLIPAEFSATAVLDADELAETIRRLAVVAARGTRSGWPSPRPGPAGVWQRHEADRTDTVVGELDGDPIAVALHPQRLLDALTAVGTGRARIVLTTSARAALITTAGDSGQDDGGPAYRRLLMPICSAGDSRPHPSHPRRTGERSPMSAGDTTLTITGNLTADPDLRFTGTGTAVAAFTVAASRRVYDQASGQWQDGDTLFLRCSAWRDLADHAAESLTKGTRVIVTGRLKQRSYETPEGDKRTVYELDVEDLGPSLKWATAKIAKTSPDKSPPPADDGDPWLARQPAEVAGDGDRPPF